MGTLNFKIRPLVMNNEEILIKLAEIQGQNELIMFMMGAFFLGSIMIGIVIVSIPNDNIREVLKKVNSL